MKRDKQCEIRIKREVNYTVRTPMCENTIHIIYSAKCVLKCAHILIPEFAKAIHTEQEVSVCAENSIHLINNIQLTEADNM